MRQISDKGCSRRLEGSIFIFDFLFRSSSTQRLRTSLKSYCLYKAHIRVFLSQNVLFPTPFLIILRSVTAATALQYGTLTNVSETPRIRPATPPHTLDLATISYVTSHINFYTDIFYP
jgi:hypothetical protein